MNDIDKMPSKCHACPYWEACDYPYICPDVGRIQPNQNAELGKMVGDTISRQAALNMKFSEGYNNDGVVFVPLRDVTEWIKNLPSAQPEIIRCRDCEFWTKQPDSLQGRCALSGTYPTGAWYCGNAMKGG